MCVATPSRCYLEAVFERREVFGSFVWPALAALAETKRVLARLSVYQGGQRLARGAVRHLRDSRA